MLRFVSAIGSIAACMLVSGCITASMQGYADREQPAGTVSRVATLVAASPALASSLQNEISREAKNRGLNSRDMYDVLPPTRQYTNQEAKTLLAKDGIDAVLVIEVGDTGIQKEYAGTFFSGSVSGNPTFATFSGSASPTYRYSRQTAFRAKLLEVRTGRSLWVGDGQVRAGGLLFIGDGANAATTAATILDDLQRKGVLQRAPSA